MVASRSDDPLPLGYAGPDVVEAGAGESADGSIGFLSTAQSILAVPVLAVAVAGFAGGPPPGSLPARPGADLARPSFWLVYAALSGVALAGSAWRWRRRALYRIYVFGLPVASVVVTAAVVATGKGEDPDRLWQTSAVYLLLNPAWLALAVRGRRRKQRG